MMFAYTNVRRHSKKIKRQTFGVKNLWRTVRCLTLSDKSVTTDFAPISTFPRRTIPRRFFWENNSTFYHFDCDVKQQKFVELRFNNLKTTSWLWNFSRFRAEKSLRQDKKENKKLSLTTRKKINPFRVVERMLTRKKFRLLFSLFRQNFCISTATEREKN